MFKPLTLALCAIASPSLAEAPRVVTDIAPVHALAARVMQGVGTPGMIVAPGASPHDYALRPSDARALSGADLVFWIGAELTPGLEKPLATLAGDAESIALLHADATLARTWRETFHSDEEDGHEGHATEERHDDHDHDHEGHDDHDHEEHALDDHGHGDHDHDDEGHAHDDHKDHAHEGHAHDHDGEDPHAWLDPENGKAWLGLMAETLASRDPANAALYRANAAAGQDEIDAAVAQIETLLQPVADHPYIVFHDAYQYFEHRFGLRPVGAISLADASDPSPARIAALRDTLRDTGATCVFSEPQFTSGLTDAVFDGTTARTALIDPLGSDLEPGPDFYPALLLSLARAIAGCL
ncbi:zinc ABC transporter substrate-binding protein [Oceaniglobus trochenteri]|uniref:zinc ABC transporter substrate-binding protein n=1 Tax=Oceaniglobus trochenteri TaxID=2763260 RepID=UPI001CFFC81C|nr:zinc ABC transporter substrate-binding protein [Oceaniglobus trochenteri]